MADAIVIPGRFNGPRDSGNGGYSCGVVGALVGNPAAVSLRAPPPLERELAVERADGAVVVRDGDTLVADGRPARLELEPPEPVTFDDAGRAREHGYARWSDSHPFPTCVVCGPDREPLDGFRIFPGEVKGRDVFAAPWTPDGSLAGHDGLVRPECVWAALDCPTSAPGAPASRTCCCPGGSALTAASAARPPPCSARAGSSWLGPRHSGSSCAQDRRCNPAPFREERQGGRIISVAEAGGLRATTYNRAT